MRAVPQTAVEDRRLERIYGRPHILEALPPGRNRDLDAFVAEQFFQILQAPAVISDALYVEA